MVAKVDPTSRPSRVARAADLALRSIVDIALALHFASAALWWWFSPQGFPIASNQFWTNSVLPVAAMGIAAVGLIAMHFGRRAPAASSIACFAGAWVAAAVAARIVFPWSLAGLWLLFLLVGLVGAALFVLLTRGSRRVIPAWAAAAATGIVIGLLVVRWQIPEPPSTIPWKAVPAREVAAHTETQFAPKVAIAPSADFYPAAVQLTRKHGNITIDCSPLLEFHRVSRDHFWSLLARARWTPVRRVVNQTSTKNGFAFHFDDGSTVHFPHSSNDGVVTLSAHTSVDTDTYTHLNTFCYLEIRGHRSLALSFSPCPTEIIDVLPADYPFGRPARFAYVDAAATFHVCEASSGEKGPFRSLAAGEMKRGESLTITLYDERQPIASIALDDWSAQLSTAISPAAGWNVPVNAIEFQRLGDAPADPAGIWITLAATSVGRGFETVGHRAGTYRNRIKFLNVPTTP